MRDASRNVNRTHGSPGATGDVGGFRDRRRLPASDERALATAWSGLLRAHKDSWSDGPAEISERPRLATVVSRIRLS
jgi:hypothetical protein